MLKKTSVIATCLLVTALLFGVVTPLFAHPAVQGEGKASFGCEKDQNLCVVQRFTSAADNLIDANVPAFAAPVKPVSTSDAKISVSYTVISRGNLTASLSEFKSQANQTLNDSRGWSRLGLSFKEVKSKGDFVLVLSEASQVPSFSPGCDSQYSCRVGDYVIINENRWKSATSSWNKAGGSLRDYRHTVINHEVGHWLGHGHYNCGGSGQKAPVMQQQSIDLQGCKFNAWPLGSELSAPRYGV